MCLFVDEASKEKERLEEKQRAARKERARNDEQWSTRWAHINCLVSMLLAGKCYDVQKQQMVSRLNFFGLALIELIRHQKNVMTVNVFT